MDMAIKKKSPAQGQHFLLLTLGKEPGLRAVGRRRRELSEEINFSLRAKKGEGTCEWLFKWHH